MVKLRPGTSEVSVFNPVESRKLSYEGERKRTHKLIRERSQEKIYSIPQMEETQDMQEIIGLF